MAATKLTTIHKPKNDYSWPTKGLVQIGPATETLMGGQRHTVFLDGQEIGSIESHQHRPSEKVTGTRLRRELAPRLAWMASLKTSQPDPGSRIPYTARIKAIRSLLNSHIA